MSTYDKAMAELNRFAEIVDHALDRQVGDNPRTNTEVVIPLCLLMVARAIILAGTAIASKPHCEG